MDFEEDTSHARYSKIQFLGEGQFATVYKALDTETKTLVAVKKIKLGSRIEAEDGINRTALREIKILHSISHPNIIGLLDVFGHRSDVSLVFEFCQTDLEVIIRDKSIVLTPANIKSYLLMTLKGLRYLHVNWILHRDLKPNNLLIASDGQLKLADFGLAKVYGSPDRIYTHQVVTRWYRAPELLYGARSYGPGIDVWAVGCIAAELLLRNALFPGDTDLDQLSKIFFVTGTPVDSLEDKSKGSTSNPRCLWPGVKSLPDYIDFNFMPGVPLQEIFTAADDDLIQVISEMIILEPRKRLSCDQILQSKYFFNKPYPTNPVNLKLPDQNEGQGDIGLNVTKGNKRFDKDVPSMSAKRLQFD